MVKVNDEFDTNFGNTYLIPYDEKTFILAQVGFGGDLGVFDGLYGRDADVNLKKSNILFRVHYGRISPIKHRWIRLGMRPYADELFRPQPYLHRAIGSDDCILVTYGQDDRHISCNDALGAYEPLATWSHEHIVERFQNEQLHR